MSDQGSVFQVWPDAKSGEITFEYRDASHRYWMIVGGERSPVVSVTTALKVLNKPALVYWAERQGIEAALQLERAGALKGVEIADATKVIRRRDEGADARRDSAAARGTAVHAALEAYCEAGTPPSIADFDPEVRGYVQALCRWLIAADPEPIATEVIVGSRANRFAGRFDLLGRIDGRRMVVDLKTSGAVYPEHHLQLAAYQGAIEACGLEPVEGGLVVAVDAEGTYHARESCASYERFLAVLEADRAFKAVATAAKALEEQAEAVTV